MIDKRTEKGKTDLGQAVTLAKQSVIDDINREYESILKDLSE